MTDLTIADQRLRQSLLKGESPDLLVVGGGITGAAIFAKAAASGIKVWLIEKNDFASGTSSRSSKMLHGGLRYLAQGDIALVKQSANQILWFKKAFPDHVSPLPFLYLHEKNVNPQPYLMDLILRFYDHLSHGKAHSSIEKKKLNQLMPGFNSNRFTSGSLYYDSITDDVSLVLSLLKTGVAYGGLCANYISLKEWIREPKTERIVGAQVAFTLNSNVINRSQGVKHSQKIEHSQEIECSNISLKNVHFQHAINATGTWSTKLSTLPKGHLRPLRGSHIAIPFNKLPAAASLTFRHPTDQRPVYAYPWQGVTIMGCTDVEHEVSLDQELTLAHEPFMNDSEKNYLMEAVTSIQGQHCVNDSDIISSWSGVRPIISEHKLTEKIAPSKEPRHHKVWSEPGLTSVAGGKLVTAMVMADEVLQKSGLQWNNIINKSDIQWHSYQRPETLQQLPVTLKEDAPKSLVDILLRRSRLALTHGKLLNNKKSAIQMMCVESSLWTEQEFDDQWHYFWRHWEQFYSPSPLGYR